MIPRLVALATAVPPYTVGQEDAREFARHLFREVLTEDKDRHIDRAGGYDDTEEQEGGSNRLRRVSAQWEHFLGKDDQGEQQHPGQAHHTGSHQHGE